MTYNPFRDLTRLQLGKAAWDVKNRLKPPAPVARTPGERKQLVEDVWMLISAFQAYFPDHTPGRPVYDATTGRQSLAQAFMQAYDSDERNLRLELLREAAELVFDDRVQVDSWLNSTGGGRLPQFAHYMAMGGREGLEAALKVLDEFRAERDTS